MSIKEELEKKMKEDKGFPHFQSGVRNLPAFEELMKAAEELGCKTAFVEYDTYLDVIVEW